MNIKKIVASIALAGAVLSVANVANALSFDYSSTTGSKIVFSPGGSFTFTLDGSGNNFSISDGSAAGLNGKITGTYNIGTITTSGTTSTAPVTGNGQVFIFDGANTFTANLTWVDITQQGAGNTLNVNGQVNLSGITYTGSNADLLALKNAGNGIDVLTTQFVPPVLLSTLKASGGSSSFSGTIGVPDGGTTVALLGMALTGVELLRRKFKV